MHADRDREILIVGAGAVGLGIGSCLIGPERRVRFAARPETAAALRESGLVRSGIFGRVVAKPDAFDAVAGLDALPRRAVDRILVCVKSYDSEAVARALAARPWLLHEQTRIVLFQNGWGNAEVFAGHLPRERVFAARVITGFRRHAANHVDVTVHAAPIHIGSPFGCDAAPLTGLARAIDAGGLPCRIASDITRDLWAKLLYNCALNPLGAILGVPYGALGETAPTRAIIDGIVREVFAAMAAAGYAAHWADADAYLADFYGQILPPTAEHESSMLQDLRAGKRTEIDALNGAVVKLAEKEGIATPVNAALANLIRFLEAKRHGAP
ncbi:MAG: ketopantoate reductase family protein [Deltaproteobacteria bacterium]|nr:MAG: ketopantoate reductase family protein [Deltaproteobacteria bacterium]